MDGNDLWLKNVNCQAFSSPEMCPNTWLYDWDWKIDTELKVECGMI